MFIAGCSNLRTVPVCGFHQIANLLPCDPKVRTVCGMISGYADKSASFRKRSMTLDTLNVFSAESEMRCAIRARRQASPSARAFMAILNAKKAVRPAFV